MKTLKFTNKLNLPTPKVYLVTYRKSSGEIKNYETSVPISANEQSITVYAFKQGIKTFIKSNILSMKEIKVVNTVI